MAALAACAMAGCGRDEAGRTELWGYEAGAAASDVRVLPLAAADAHAAALHAPGDGVVWLAGGGTVTALDVTTGTVLRRAELDDPGTPHFLGFAAERLYLRVDGVLLTLDPAGEVRARREVGDGAVALDPLGRYVYLATENGAVIGLHPRLLRPEWAWARLGPAATTLGVSPEGDRLYLAMAGSAGEPAVLLVRDVQTGRVLLRAAQPGEPHELRVSPAGDLFTAVGGPEPVLVAWRPRRGGLHELWRRELDVVGADRRMRLRMDGEGGRLFAFAPGAGSAQLFDLATGEPVGGRLPAPLDAAFAPDGGLILLYPGELRVVR